jgi:DNA-binding response OmpR family regulator
MTSSKVLLIDDDPLLLALLRHKLSARGYFVDTAEDGATGLERASAGGPDIIVLDMMMPVLDGRAVLQELRRTPALREVPVVVLTSRAREDDVLDMLRLGASDYLVKPFSPDELTVRIDKLTANSGVQP